MAVIRPEKVAKVAEIQELLSNSKCTILVVAKCVKLAFTTM